MNDRVAISGYSKSEIYNGNIRYRNFSPDLVGVQLTSDGGTPLFTMGNFSITTNMDPKFDKKYSTRNFSNFVSLTDLNLSLDQANTLLRDNDGVFLNLDKTNLKNTALFGSLTEYVRTSLEDIITKWPASLYLSPLSQTASASINGYTFEDYLYNNITEISTFKINTNFIVNNFEINYLNNGSILDTFNSSNDLRNITVNFESYVIYINNVEYPVLDFLGSDTLKNDYVYLNVKGDPFSGLTSGYIRYHIKPNNTELEKFFNGLPEFESYLLNRMVVPKYTSTFNYSLKSEVGTNIFTSKSVTWPVSDGYNIDFNTTDYGNYVNDLIEIATGNDLTTSDLMYRFLVSESISDFDTTPVRLSYLQQDSTGQKMTKVLRIYGRNFDDLNTYIEGISFANVVSYDKLNNMPDIYIKNLARVLGWELITSVIEVDLLSNYVKAAKSTYPGHTVGLTPVQADIELWRRLILNTPWLWKSKGARKSVEFLLNFVGIPKGLVEFNEHIYKAEAPINMVLFEEVLLANNLDTDLSIYPISQDGYPEPLPNTPNMYFQNKGLWYRETGGSNATLDILGGNNPHVGPYDGGSTYINQFRTLIPDFSAVTLTSETVTTNSSKLFSNYNSGEITNYTGNIYVTATNTNGSSLNDCIVVQSSIIPDPMPSPVLTECGCPNDGDDDSLSICLSAKDAPITNNCENILSTSVSESGYFIFTQTSSDLNGAPINIKTEFASQECCRTRAGGIPNYYNDVVNGIVVNSGYFCCSPLKKICGCFVSCNWKPQAQPILLPVYPINVTGPQSNYLQFTRPDGTTAVVTSDGSHCLGILNTFIIPTPNITDPLTGEIGVGCKLTSAGIADLNLGNTSIIYSIYLSRYKGEVGFGCCELDVETYLKYAEAIGLITSGPTTA
jgi:hypothetical protein